MRIAKEFKDFLMQGSVVDLAVAVVIGAAFGAVVASFVGDLLTPLIAAILGEPDFSDLTFTINDSQFRYGSFVNALVTFAAVAATIFFVVIKPINALRARRRAQAEAVDAPTEEVKLLTEIRDSLQNR